MSGGLLLTNNNSTCASTAVAQAQAQKTIVTIKEGSRASTEAMLKLTPLAPGMNQISQPAQSTGKFMFLSDFEVELIEGTTFKFAGHSCYTGAIGHFVDRTNQPALINGLVSVKKGINYTDTDVTKGCIVKETKADQKFVLEKDTKVMLKKGTKVHFTDIKFDCTLDKDCEVLINC